GSDQFALAHGSMPRWERRNAYPAGDEAGAMAPGRDSARRVAAGLVVAGHQPVLAQDALELRPDVAVVLSRCRLEDPVGDASELVDQVRAVGFLGYSPAHVLGQVGNLGVQLGSCELHRGLLGPGSCASLCEAAACQLWKAIG